MWTIVLGAVAFILVYVTHWIYRWRNPKCKGGGILPPGSSGFPLIGESLQLIKPSYSLGTSPFITQRVKKYGSLFRTNIAGRHIIISTDLQANNFIFQQEEKLVEQWYLDSFDKIMNAAAVTEVHKNFRGMLLSHIGLNSLKEKLLPQFEELASTTFQLWSTQDSTEVRSATNKAFVELAAKVICSYDPRKSEELASKLNLLKGLMCFPINIPGTTYHNFLKDKKELTKMLSNTVGERLSSPENLKGDLLDHLVQLVEKDKIMTEDILVNVVLVLIFGASSGSAFTFTLALKFISENPSVLRELTAEHEKILEQRKDRSSSISWEDYKSMSFTHQVIKETLRMGTTIPGVIRRVKKDFILNGYTIPEGWVIIPAVINLHFDPTIFENPQEFNPWRWKDLTSDASKYCNPFGAGIRQCVGADYTRVLLCIFFHVLVTKYRWELIGGGDIVRNPVARFKTDLRIKVSKRNVD